VVPPYLYALHTDNGCGPALDTVIPQGSSKVVTIK
jgi:hypothetical protein